MSKEKEIKIEDANANEKVDEQQTEKQAEQAQTDNLSAEDGKEKETEELDPLAKAEQEVESLKKQLLYKTAEFENYRKRTLKEKADLILNGGEKTIAAILPILDDFENTKNGIDVMTPTSWFISSVPSLNFKEDYNDKTGLTSGFHRSRLAWYCIDPLFTRRGNTKPDGNDG